MAYVAGLYTKASQAASDETKRYGEFLGTVDAMAAREREAARRQQQVAMDRQFAGLAQPGQASGFAGQVAAPKAEQFPARAGLPMQAVSEPLYEPAPATAGITPFRTSPGPIEAGGIRPPTAPITADQTTSAAYDIFLAPYSSKPEAAVRNYNATIVNPLREAPLQGLYDFFTAKGEVLSRQQTQKVKDAAIEWYQKDEVRNALLSDPAAITEARKDPVGYYQKNRDKVAVQPPVPTTEAKTDSLVTAQPQFQPQPVPAPTSTGAGITNAPTAVANTPLEVPASVPVKDQAFASQSAAKLESEFLPRVAEVPTMVASDSVQKLIRRATEFGVDPAAAVAIYGVETNFGRRVGVSEKGASGLMQVTPATFKDMKRFFTDPAEIKRYNIPQVLVDAAANMSPTDKTSFDAGLLRMKYAELKGVDKNLLGAGYNASAETIVKLGRPLASGAGITNEDYNKAYIALYNEARNYVGISPTVTADVATNSSYNLERYDREQQVYQAQYESELGILKAEYDRQNALRSRLVQQIQFAQQSGYYNQIPELQRQLDGIDSVILDVNKQATDRNNAYRAGLENFNTQRIAEFANIAVYQMKNGDGGPLSAMWSRASGMDVQLQPTPTGGYNVFINGQLDSANVPAATIESSFMSQFSTAYAAQQAATREKMAEEKFKADKDIAIEELKQLGALTLEKMKQQKPEWSDLKEQQDTEGNVIGYTAIDTNSGRFIRMRIKPGVEVAPGLNTVEDFDITVRDLPGLTGTAQ